MILRPIIEETLKVNTLYLILCTLADIYLRTDSFQKNVLSYYSGTTQDNETNDTSFESPIIELLEIVMKEGVAVS